MKIPQSKFINIIIIGLVLLFPNIGSPQFLQHNEKKSRIIEMSKKGIELIQADEIDKALEIFNQALDECEKIDFKEAEVVIIMMIKQNIADILSKKGSFTEAKKNYEEILEMYKEIVNKDYKVRFLNGYILFSLGTLYFNKIGDSSKALNYLIESEKVFKEIDDKKCLGSSCSIIGVVYLGTGDLQKALEYFKKTLEISKEISDKELERATLEQMGILYIHLNNPERASYYLSKSLKLSREMNDYDSEITILRQLGQFDFYFGKHKKALASFKEGLNITKKNNDKRREGLFKLYIALTLQRLKQYDEALQYFNQTLIKIKEINDTKSESLVLSEIGNTYGFLGKWSEALDFQNQALKIARKFNEKDSLMFCSFYIAEAFINLGKNDEALPYLKNAIVVLESMRGGIEEEIHKINFLEKIKHIYEYLIINLYRLHVKEPNAVYAKEALIYAEKTKARALIEMLTEANFGIQMGLAPEERENENYLYNRINILRKSIADTKEELEIKRLSEEIKIAEEKLEEFKNSIKKSNPLYASVQYPEPLTVDELQRKVIKNKDVALLEYFMGIQHSFLFILTRKKFKLLKLDKKNSEIVLEIKNLRESFEKIGNSMLELKRLDISIAQKLYNELISPAIPYLEGIKKLIIIPHGSLYYLPFEMLVSQVSEEYHDENVLLSEYSAPRYLIEDYLISYAPSASVLDPNLLTRKRKEPQKGDVLAMANPDFEVSQQEEHVETEANVFITKSMREKIGRLPNSEKEVEEIKKFFNNAKTYMSKNATEQNFISDSPYYPVIHISTHGFLNENNPIYSALAFSYNEDIKDIDLLHAYEIFNLNLSCELVTLSACETALGHNLEKIGGEGVVGLTRAFLYAGAKSLIVSLWKVEDESTSILMSEFYKNWREKGLSKIEALREAKLALMTKMKKIGNKYLSYAHPFFWAPFILIGQSN